MDGSVYERIYGETGGQAIIQEVRIHPDVILAVKAGVSEEDAAAGPKV